MDLRLQQGLTSYRVKAMTEEQIRTVLKKVTYPGFSRDIVSFGLIREVRSEGKKIVIQMVLTTNDTAIARKIETDAREAILAAGSDKEVEIRIDIQAPAQAAGLPGPEPLSGVRHVLAVASGKGGVGKSTVAANLTLALHSMGLRTGLCDCDLYGPSIAKMFGGDERPMADDQNRIIPISIYGVKLMSMGFLLEDGAPAVLRGPMATRYTQQFLRQVQWDPLDVLILDLPPGTGDIQLTIVQTVALTGAVVVTTPQEVALIDARKAVGMFEKTNVPTLGLVENMSFFRSPSDGKKYPIFGMGGGQSEARRMGVPLLGEIPIEPEVCESGDQGTPVVLGYPESEATGVFRKMASELMKHLK